MEDRVFSGLYTTMWRPDLTHKIGPPYGLSGRYKVTSIEGALVVSSATALESIDGLSTLASITRQLVVSYNPELTSVSLPALSAALAAVASGDGRPSAPLVEVSRRTPE
jgi:hypothetical protein